MSTAQQAARAWRGSWVPPHLRRRLLAALLAAAGVLIALSSLKPGPSSPAKQAAPSPSAALLGGLRPGQVAAPIRLVDPGVAPLLHLGESVDVLAASESPAGPVDASQTLARVVAQGVRVLAVSPPATSDSSLGTLVVLAVSRADAQALAGAEAGGRLSVTLEPS
jgi:pilus assembly protein CpaB